MSTTEDTNATRRGSELGEGLGLAPKRGHRWGEELVRGAKVRCGDYVGEVCRIMPTSFYVLFPWPEPMQVRIPGYNGAPGMTIAQTHFSRRFRRFDGRSMGSKVYTWAVPYEA